MPTTEDIFSVMFILPDRTRLFIEYQIQNTAMNLLMTKT